jgi:hypothetical protein
MVPVKCEILYLVARKWNGTEMVKRPNSSFHLPGFEVLRFQCQASLAEVSPLGSSARAGLSCGSGKWPCEDAGCSVLVYAVGQRDVDVFE